jgi:UDP-N-acetylglucosamine 2-epimerase (non-hydrolysing)
MNVLLVAGTRPEAIKLAPVALAASADAGRLTVRLCLTGQHREMLDQVVRSFALPVHHDLDIMTVRQSPTAVAAAVLERLEPVLRAETPDWVVVQGDTTSAMAAALAGFLAGCRVAHVEAGLRTGHRRNPFPEEVNRRLVVPLADLHFAPTEGARRALIAEGVPPDEIAVTGNTVVDALHWAREQPPTPRFSELAQQLGLRTDLQEPGAWPRVVLVTAHRRESFGSPIERICVALRNLAERYGTDMRLVYPVHPNPQICEPVKRLLSGVPALALIEPLDYLTQVQLLARSRIVLTDSGGIQEEAPSLGVPALVLRDTTERPEAVACGAARLVGTDISRIVSAFSALWEDESAWRQMRVARNPYGDGHASRRIIQALLQEPLTPFHPDRIDAPSPIPLPC